MLGKHLVWFTGSQWSILWTPLPLGSSQVPEQNDQELHHVTGVARPAGSSCYLLSVISLPCLWTLPQWTGFPFSLSNHNLFVLRLHRVLHLLTRPRECIPISALHPQGTPWPNLQLSTKCSHQVGNKGGFKVHTGQPLCGHAVLPPPGCWSPCHCGEAPAQWSPCHPPTLGGVGSCSMPLMLPTPKLTELYRGGAQPRYPTSYPPPSVCQALFFLHFFRA